VYAYFTVDFSPELTESTRQYGFTSVRQLLLIQISFVLIYLGIWITAGLGISSLFKSVSTLDDTHVQKGVSLLAWGLFILLLELISSSLLSATTKTFVADDVLSAATVTIFTNYIHVFFPLAGFLCVLAGTFALNCDKKSLLEDGIISTIVTVLFGVFYVLLIFTNETRQVSTDPLTTPSYYISDALITGTIILPVLLGWLCSFLAVLRLSKFFHSSMQRSATSNIVNGLFFIIFSSIVLQALLSLGSSRWVSIGIVSFLGIIYLFFLLLLIGYALILRGARFAFIPPSPQK
jgi:hypothetical protein